MRGEIKNSVHPQRQSWFSQSSALASPRCPSTLSRCRTHERWCLTHINSLDAQWTWAQRKERGRNEKPFHLCHCYQRRTPSSKKTAGWHVVHLSLKAPGQKRVEVQVADPVVWLQVCLCHDTRWMQPLRAGENPPWKSGHTSGAGRDTQITVVQIRRQAQPGSQEREWKKENHLTSLFSGGQRCPKLDIKTQIAFRRVTPCQEILHVWLEETTIPISLWENNIFIFWLFIEWKLWGIHFYGLSGRAGVLHQSKL